MIKRNKKREERKKNNKKKEFLKIEKATIERIKGNETEDKIKEKIVEEQERIKEK